MAVKPLHESTLVLTLAVTVKLLVKSRLHRTNPPWRPDSFRLVDWGVSIGQSVDWGVLNLFDSVPFSPH